MKKFIIAAAFAAFWHVPAFSQTETFEFTGDVQTWVVPAGVTSVTIEAWGAEGGGAYNCAGDNENEGGLGGYATGSLAVTPGQTLSVYVGGKPVGPGNNSDPSAGGWNGGGDAGQYGAGGGGASDIRVGGTALADRVIVAGGGGGDNAGCPNHGVGGAGGGLEGLPGESGQGFTPGGGGTQVVGGTAGASPGEAGQLGIGGGSNEYHIAGGGGGYYGGGSAYASGGGGGSSFIGGVTDGTTQPGVRSGDGLVIISVGGDAVPGAQQIPALPIWALILLVGLIPFLVAGRRRRG